MQLKTIPIQLESAVMISKTVKHFRFKSEQPFSFIPGQFITIHFERDGKKLRRSYSIANVPANDNFIEFAANYVEGGPGTELLFQLPIGGTIQINGPFGRLVLKEPTPSRFIFMATSTGVTPYRAMHHALQQRLDENPGLQVVLLLGVQTRQDILYEAEFLAWATNHDRVTFHAYLSREPKDLTLNPHERLGHIQNAFPELKLHPAEDLVYLCGNPAMIDDSVEQLKDLGFSIQQLIREKYISA